MRLACVVFSLFVSCSTAAHPCAGDDDFAFFESRVRPLLTEHCLPCHGGEKTKGGLALDSRDGWLKGGDSGPALVPGNPDESLLLKAVRHEELEMPPDKQLTSQEIADLETWIRSGAPDPRVAGARLGGMKAEEARNWWSFQPLVTPAQRLTTASINAMLDEELKKHQLIPLPPADKRTLIRRATFDLTGLPPTAAEVEAFLADNTPDAFDKVIDRLLDSPQYGVQWGRHWLDVVRYADTAGENTDRPLPHAWRYRNWVFESLQQDLPFDQFTRLQLAGDLIAANGTDEERRAGLIATGYLAVARRFGHDLDQETHLMHEDVIDNLGKSFVGLTIGCARCHDHKYDPVTAQDYYALYGIFSSTKFAFPGCEAKGQPRDLVPLLTPIQIDEQLGPWRTEVAQIEQQKLERRTAIEREAKLFREATAGHHSQLAIGKVDEGSETQLLTPEGKPLAPVAVRKGELLILSILPNGNHGADSTLVDWTIANLDQPEQSWNSRDLSNDLLAGNPQPVADGAQWVFLDVGGDGPVPLLERRAANGGTDSIPSWSIGSEPSVFANRTDQPLELWAKFPPKSIFLHPGDKRPVALGWISPVDATLTLSGKIADIHAAPGLDGVSFELTHDTLSDPVTAGRGAPDPARTPGDLLLSLFAAHQLPIASPSPPPTLPVTYGVVEGTSNDAALQLRGEPEQLGPPVPRRWLEILGGAPLPPNSGSGRKELAEWIISSPLFARVLVNRVWQWHFGAGLVRTPSDFGSRGELPTHPELLEALAAELIANGYQLKPLHRMIMQTEAYQRGSLGRGELIEVDPENRYLARYSRRRLTAEEIRDSLLQTSGQLDSSPAEAHPFPPEASWGFTQHEPFNAVYESRKRSAFLMVQRQRRHPFLALFDGADPNASTPQRQQTNVSTQALYFLNDPFFHEQAGAVATELLKAEASERASELYSRLLQRPATHTERERIDRLIESYPGSEQEKWAAAARIVMASNEFLFLD
jgi:hypothetical protein